MAKKKAAKKAAPSRPKAAAKSPADINTAVKGANEAVKAVFTSEDERRLRLLKENEFLSKKTVDTEVDVRRLLDEQARLKNALSGLTKEQSALAQDVKALSAKVNAQEKECKLTKAKKADLGRELSELEKDVHKLSNDNASLDKEVRRLGTQRDKLEADVRRLEKLRDEYVKTIAKFKEEKNGLLS